jgi:hypothetical protein
VGLQLSLLLLSDAPHRLAKTKTQLNAAMTRDINLNSLKTPSGKLKLVTCDFVEIFKN